MSHGLPVNVSTSYFHFMTNWTIPADLFSSSISSLSLLPSEAWEPGHMVQSWATMHQDEETSGASEAEKFFSSLPLPLSLSQNRRLPRR